MGKQVHGVIGDHVIGTRGRAVSRERERWRIICQSIGLTHFSLLSEKGQGLLFCRGAT